MSRLQNYQRSLQHQGLLDHSGELHWAALRSVTVPHAQKSPWGLWASIVDERGGASKQGWAAGGRVGTVITTMYCSLGLTSKQVHNPLPRAWQSSGHFGPPMAGNVYYTDVTSLHMT